MRWLMAAAVAAVGSAAGAATTLAFDTAADCSTSEVTITRADTGGPCSQSDGAIAAGRTDYLATFSTLRPVTEVGILIGDDGGDDDRFFLEALDAAGARLAYAFEDVTFRYTLRTDPPVRLSVAAPDIAAVRFGSTGNINGGFQVLELRYTVAPIPIPASGLLLAGACIAVATAAGRPRRNRAGT